MRPETKKNFDRLRRRDAIVQTWLPVGTVIIPLTLVLIVYQQIPDARSLISRFALFGALLTAVVPTLLAATFWLFGISGWRKIANWTLGHDEQNQFLSRWSPRTRIERQIPDEMSATTHIANGKYSISLESTSSPESKPVPNSI